MKVKEVMTRGVECTRPDATLREAAEKMKTLDVGPLPVCENDQLVGMITDRDVTVRATARGFPPGLGQVRDVMTPDVIYCFEDQDVGDAVHLMEQHQVRRLVVLNPEKHLVGIISLGDLAVKGADDRLSGEALEQISEPAAPRR
jgi:CBS domain-containing protein